MPFADYQPGLAPTWLRNAQGEAWSRALGALKDTLVSDADLAVKCRMAGICPADALAPLGDERGIPRTPVDTDATYRAKLLRAWELWPWAGSAYGMLQIFYLSGYPSVSLYTQSGKQYTLSGAYDPAAPSPLTDVVVSSLASPVHLGGTPTELWSDFGVTIHPPWPAWWAGVAPADGSDDQRAMAGLVAGWKPGHCRCVKLTVVTGTVWDDGSLWDDGTTWDDGTVTVWTPPAG